MTTSAVPCVCAVYPCTATLVLAHTSATFGFPEIRRGALPGLVSVGAQQRLTPALCERLMCTGDVLDAQAAHRAGLVDFVGSTAELEDALQSLQARFHQLGAALLCRCKRVLSVRQHRLYTPTSSSLNVDAVRMGWNSERSIAVISARMTPGSESDCVQGLESAIDELLRAPLVSLRVLVLDVTQSPDACGSGPNESSRLEHQLDALHSLGVPVLCSIAGSAAGLLLKLLLSLDHCVADASTTFESTSLHLIQTDDDDGLAHVPRCRLVARGVLDAKEAQRLGLVGDIVDVSGGALTEVLKQASWLCSHSKHGIKHMLRLTHARRVPMRQQRSSEEQRLRHALRRTLFELDEPAEDAGSKVSELLESLEAFQERHPSDGSGADHSRRCKRDALVQRLRLMRPTQVPIRAGGFVMPKSRQGS